MRTLRTPRRVHQATKLGDGTVLVTGGYNTTIPLGPVSDAHSLRQTEQYVPDTS